MKFFELAKTQETNTMQEIIIQILTDIENRKKEENREPTHPLLIEVRKELSCLFISELEKMQSSGKIKIGNTFNDKYIQFLDV